MSDIYLDGSELAALPPTNGLVLNSINSDFGLVLLFGLLALLVIFMAEDIARSGEK